MSSEMACLRRCIIALCALVWLLTTVGDHVPPQSSCFAKGFFTFWASVCLDSTVGKQVLFQMCSSPKWLVTLITSVCPFYVVGFHVSFQCFNFTKWFLAFETNIHFFPFVGEHWHFNLVRRGLSTAVLVWHDDEKWDLNFSFGLKRLMKILVWLAVYDHFYFLRAHLFTS